MDNITISEAWGWVIAAAAAIVALSQAYKVIKAAITRPEIDMVHKHAEQLARDNRRLQALEDAQEDAKHCNAVQLRSIQALINHELSGNDVDHLRSARDEINDYLTNRM